MPSQRVTNPRPLPHACAVLTTLALAIAAPGSTLPPRIDVPRAAHAPRLSEYIEASPSRPGLALTDFRQREPKDGEPASRTTVAYVSYDDKNFYVVFVCSEEPSKVRAHIAKRESVVGDDLVGVSLDTFHDGRRAYVFYANPFGIQADGIATEGQRDDYTFDALWHSEGRVTSTGYAVLIAIPFHSLRFSQDPASTWGIALTRFIPETSEAATWPHISSKIDAYIPQFATMSGFQNVAPASRAQIIPYVFSGRSTFPNTADPSRLDRMAELRGGVDAKVTLRNGLTIDSTINPDFSQIESDEPQVTVNQRYEVAFPERRPFFQDNAAYFQTPESLFFSRRIVDPQFGAKITGKVGSWAVGALAMDDRAPGRSLSETSAGSGETAMNGIVRLQRDLGNESTAGFFASSREFAGNHNEVFSGDVRLKLTPNWVFTGQLGRSTWTEDGQTATGSLGYAEIRRSGRSLNYHTEYRYYSPDFHSDLGYIPRVDIRQLRNVAGYKWFPEKGVLLDFGPSLFTTVTYDHTGRLQDWSVNAPFFIDLKGPINIAFDSGQSYEVYANRGFRKSYNLVYANFERWKRASLTASFSAGRGLNYYPAAGAAPFTAPSRDAQVVLTLRPSTRLRIDETLLYTQLGFQSAQVFSNTMVRSRVAFQFTRSLSARYILDYNNITADARLIDLATQKKIQSDALFTWMLNPWTALYAGYGDTRQPGMPQTLPSRHLFVKFSYLIRL